MTDDVDVQAVSVISQAGAFYVPPDDVEPILPLLTLGAEAGGIMSADAQTILASQFGMAMVQLSAKASREAAFLILYAGDWGRSVCQFAFSLKPHQTFRALPKLEKAMAALSLKEFMSRININLGGK